MQFELRMGMVGNGTWRFLSKCSGESEETWEKILNVILARLARNESINVMKTMLM